MRATKVVPDDVSGLDKMKKQYLWLFAMPIMLAMLCSSCTKENDSGDNGNGNNNSGNIKIEKTTTLLYGDHVDYTDGSINSNYTYEWDGDKLMKLDNATGWDMAFTYDGDNVSEVFWYSDNGGSIHPYKRYNYTYSGDKVIEYTYTYLANGSNSTTTYHVNYDNEGNVSEITTSNNDGNTTKQYTWQNGNITQCVSRYNAISAGGRSYTVTETYTYDNHKSLKNLIAGYGARQYANGYNPSSINNVLTYTRRDVYDDDGEEKVVDCDGVFLAVGLIPENQNFTNVAKLDERGYFDADEYGKTMTRNIFVAGDCRHKSLRQVATACADGANAAIQACNLLR